MSEIPAGWYPDPYETPNLYRWWDGAQWTDDTAPMSGEQAAPQASQPQGGMPQASEPVPVRPQESWQQGAPGWEPHSEPPPWDTQHGPPGLDDAQHGGPPQAGPPPLDPFVPRPQLPSDGDRLPAGRGAPPESWTPPQDAGQWSQPGAAPWSQPDAGQWQEQPDAGQWQAHPNADQWQAHPNADWGQQEPAPFPPAEPHAPQAAPWEAPPPSAPDHLGAPNPSGQPPGPPKKGRGLLVGGIAGGLALVLIIGAIVGVVLVRRSHQQAHRSQSASPSATAPASPSSTGPSSPPASPAPTGPRVTAGSISYVQLPTPWEPNGQQQFPEFDTKKGQYQYTQRNPPGVEGGWIANIYVGSLSDQFSYGGPDDLESTAGGLASSVEQKYYKPWKTKRKDLEKKKITVNGKQGYEIKFHLDFLNTPKGFAAKGETVLVAVVDSSTGGQGVYISIPDNAKKLEPTFDLVMNSLQVD